VSRLKKEILRGVTDHHQPSVHTGLVMSKRKPAAAVMAPEVTHWSYMGLSMTDDPDTRYWQTNNREAFKGMQPQTVPANSHREHQHKNISQWGLGYGSEPPPSSHFCTTNSAQFGNAMKVVPPKPPTRKQEQYVKDFENTRVPIGSTKCAATTHAPWTYAFHG